VDYAKIFVNLNKKKSISTTPLCAALKDLIFALNDSAEAFVERLMINCKNCYFCIEKLSDYETDNCL